MTTDSATAGPAATGASPAGAVPGPFPPRRDRRPSRRRPWGRPRRRPRPLHPGPRRGRHQRQGPRHRPGRVHPRLRLRRRRRLPPPPGWVERDAEAVWAAQTAAIRDCLAGAVGPPGQHCDLQPARVRRRRPRAPGLTPPPSPPDSANAQVSSRTRGWEVRVRGRAVGRGRPTAPSHPQGAHFPPVSRVVSAGFAGERRRGATWPGSPAPGRWRARSRRACSR